MHQGTITIRKSAQPTMVGHKGDGDTSIISPPKSRRSTRPLFGTLGVSGREWITVNIGLLLILCRNCNGKQSIDQERSFANFRADVENFSDVHSGCRA